MGQNFGDVSKGYTKIIPGVDFMEIPPSFFGDNDFQNRGCSIDKQKESNKHFLCFSVGGPDAFPNCAKRLSDITRPFKIDNAQADYSQPKSTIGENYGYCGFINQVVGNGLSSRPSYGKVMISSPFGPGINGSDQGVTSPFTSSFSGNSRNPDSLPSGSLRSGSGSGLNTCIDISAQKDGTAASTTDPIECNMDAYKRPADRFANSIQVFYLLFRMLESFPDVEAPFDIISERLLEISETLKKIAVDGGQNEYEFLLPGSGYPNVEKMRKKSSHYQSKKNVTRMDEFNKLLEEVWDIRTYLGSADFWNGVPRKDVSIFLTFDFPDFCRRCDPSNKRGASDFDSIHNFDLRECDHLPSNPGERDGGGMLPVRRYVTVLQANGWTEAQMNLRVRLSFWCLQNKLVAYDYGSYVMHQTPLSVYSSSILDSLGNEEQSKDCDQGGGDYHGGDAIFGPWQGHPFHFRVPGVIRTLIESKRLPFGHPLQVRNRMITDGSNIWYDLQESDWEMLFETYCRFGGMRDSKKMLGLSSFQKDLHTNRDGFLVTRVLSSSVLAKFRKNEVSDAWAFYRQSATAAVLPIFYHAQPWNPRTMLGDTDVVKEEGSSFGVLVDRDRSFLCSKMYLRDWPMLWKQHLPHYHALVSSGMIDLFPGLFGIFDTKELKEKNIISCRQKMRQIPNGATTVGYSSDYKQNSPTCAFMQREHNRPANEEFIRKALVSHLVRPGDGIHKIIHDVLSRTMLYVKRDNYSKWYLYSMRSEESNTSDVLRNLYRSGGTSNYDPTKFLMKDGDSRKQEKSNGRLSTYCEHLRRCNHELRVHYHVDSFKLTIMNDFIRMIQDSVREERDVHIHVALVSEEVPGVGKSWMPTITSHLLQPGLFMEIGHETEASNRIQIFGRLNDGVILRDEANYKLFSSRAEGNLGDPRLKQVLSQGYTVSKMVAWEPSPPVISNNFSNNAWMSPVNSMHTYGMGGSHGSMKAHSRQSLERAMSPLIPPEQPVAQGQSGMFSVIKNGLAKSKNSLSTTSRKRKASVEPTVSRNHTSSPHVFYNSSPAPPPPMFSPFASQSNGSCFGADKRNIVRTKEQIGTLVATMNLDLTQISDRALLDRFVVQCLTRSAKTVNGARLSIPEIIENVPVHVTSRFRALQMAHMEIRKMIMAGAIPPVNTHMVQILQKLISPTLKKHFLSSSSLNRDFQRMSYLASIDCIHRVVHQHFMTQNGMYYGESITPTLLRSLSPYYYINFQDASLALGSFLTQFITSVDRYALYTLRSIWVSGRVRNNPFQWSMKKDTSRYDLVDSYMKNDGSRWGSGGGSSRNQSFTPSRKRRKRNQSDNRETLIDVGSYDLHVGDVESLSEELAGEPVENVGVNEDHELLEGMTIEQFGDLVDFNYITVSTPGCQKPVNFFAKILRNEIVSYMKKEGVENVSIPEVTAVESWIRKHVQQSVEGAVRMVHVSQMESEFAESMELGGGGNDSDRRDTITDDYCIEKSIETKHLEQHSDGMKSQRRRRRRRGRGDEEKSSGSPSISEEKDDTQHCGKDLRPEQETKLSDFVCHLDNVIALERKGKSASASDVLDDIKCIEVIPKRGLRFSTYWLKYMASPFDDLMKDLADIHAHNIRWSTNEETIEMRSRLRTDTSSDIQLMVGCQDEKTLGAYKIIQPGNDPDRVTNYEESGMLIQDDFCPINSLKESVIESEKTTPVSRDLNSRAIPRQSLDEIVSRTHYNSAFNNQTDGLSPLQFLMAVSFLVIDTIGHRRLAMKCMEKLGGGISTFVHKVSETIPDSTIFSWFLRTRIPTQTLRRLFSQRYYLFLSHPSITVEERTDVLTENGEKQIFIDIERPQNFDNGLFVLPSSGLERFIEGFYSTPGFIKCSCDKLESREKSNLFIDQHLLLPCGWDFSSSEKRCFEKISELNPIYYRS